MKMRGLTPAGTLFAVLTWAGTAAADPGELVGIPIDTVGNNYGYWEYQPEAYDEDGEPWPVMLFLSGIGENGNGTLPPGGCSGPAHAGEYLCRNLRHGPQSILWNQLYEGGPQAWDDEERPMLILSPQNPAPLYQYIAYDSDDLEEFIVFVLQHYNVDPRRLYLTGMSMGGFSTLLSIADYPDRYAAASVMPGINLGPEVACNFTQMNLWAFHGENDANQFNPAGMAAFVNNFANCPAPHPTPRYTLYANAGHNVWTRTIDPAQGMDDLTRDTAPMVGGGTLQTDPYDIDLYSWLLLHDKPVVDAGPDAEVVIDEGSFSVTATTVDDDAIEYTWTQVDGPNVTLGGADTPSLTATELALGSYTFEVLAVDADQQWDRDLVIVQVVDGGNSGSASESESESASESASGTQGSSTSTGSSSSTTGSIGTDTTGNSATAAQTSAGDGSSGEPVESETTDGRPGGSTSGSPSGSGSGSASASGPSSASESGVSATAGEGDDGGANGESSDGGSGGANDDDGGCRSGGGSPPPVWAIALFGLAAVRRRHPKA